MIKKKTPAAATTQNKGAAALLPNFSLRMTPHRRALYYTGLPHKEGILQRIYKKNPKILQIIEYAIIATIIILAMAIDLRILLILPLLGAALYFKDHFKWLFWLCKVFIFQRNFYAGRRRVYKMGSLLQYMNSWRAKRFNAQKAAGGVVIIWAASAKQIEQRFKLMAKNGTLESREYISNYDK